MKNIYKVMTALAIILVGVTLSTKHTEAATAENAEYIDTLITTNNSNLVLVEGNNYSLVTRTSISGTPIDKENITDTLSAQDKKRIKTYSDKTQDAHAFIEVQKDKIVTTDKWTLLETWRGSFSRAFRIEFIIVGVLAVFVFLVLIFIKLIGG